MPEREFELYLNLLSRFLRLDAAQREQIADELRDHFQERFEELLQAGLSREQAIGATLDEFGEAAGLAADFSHIGNRRRRRTIMRYTLSTAAALVAVIFLATTFWPEAPAPRGPARAVAQQPAQPQNAENPLAGERGKGAGSAAVEAKLDRRLPEVDFVDMPLKEVLVFLDDVAQVDLLVNERVIQDLGVSMDAAVNLKIKHTPVTARTALDLVLEQVSSDLGYTVRDGLVYITRKYDNDEIQVYNVRDLMKGYPAADAGMSGVSAPGMMPGMGRGMPGAVMPGGEGASLGGGGGLGGMSASIVFSAGDALKQVITSTIYPETWSEAGGSGSLAEFNGLLIIKQSQTVHRQIAQLLEMMRDVDKREATTPAPRRQ